MVYVAAMYEKGDGKARDRDQAMRLYRDALARPGINERNRDTATRALATAR
jgi:TPR repeat protein